MSPVRQGDNGLEKQLNWQLSCCNKWRFVRVGVASFRMYLAHHITQPNRDMANGKRQRSVICCSKWYLSRTTYQPGKQTRPAANRLA